MGAAPRPRAARRGAGPAHDLTPPCVGGIVPPVSPDLPDAPALSVVIPAYNEAARITATLDRVVAWLAAEGLAAEIVVVDDGSADATAEVVEAHAAAHPTVRLVQLQANRGKGGAVRAGVEAARGAWILISDADLSTPIEDLRLLQAAAGDDVPVVIGSRGMKESNLVKRQPIYREMMGRIFNQIVRAAVHLDLHDTQCGFKLLRADVARRVFGALATDGFAFDVEILCRAHQAGFRIVEVPVTWANDERSTVRPIRDASRMFLEVLAIRRRVAADRRAGRLVLPPEPARSPPADEVSP